MKRAITSLCICVAISFASCIDKGFDIANVSGEVTLGGEELVVPLAEISPIRFGDIIKDGDFLNSSGENGTYQISYSSYGNDPTKYESISVGGISIPNITNLSPELEPIGFSFQELPTSLMMSGISQSFEVDFPSPKNIMEIEPIRVMQELKVELPNVAGELGNLDEKTLALLAMANKNTISINGSSEVVFDAEIELLPELKKVDWVEFECDKEHHGVPFNIKVDLHGLQDVNGGGVVTLNIEFPKGYHLLDESGNEMAEQNIFSKEITLKEKERSANFLVHLHRINLEEKEFKDGKLEIDDHVKFSYDLNMNLCAGSYNLNSPPKFSIEATPVYKDVEVVINHFDIEKVTYPVNYTFDGMPSGVNIESVAFQDTYLTFSLKGLEWLQVRDNSTDSLIPVQIKVALPECMHIEESDIYSNHTLTASAMELANGVRLKLNYIDCQAEGVKMDNGQLVIDSNIVAEVDLHEMDGHTVLVSSLTPPTSPLIVSVAIADAQLKLDIENTKVSWKGDQVYNLDLTNNIPSIKQTIEVPEMIASIKEIEIGKAGGNGEPVKIGFELSSLGVFPVGELDVDMSINLGKMLRPTSSSMESGIVTKNGNGDYILSINETWKPNSAALVKEVAFEALENLEIKDGKVVINQSFPVTGSVKIKDGQSIDTSVFDSAKIDIDVKIDDIEVRTFTGGIDLAIAPEDMIVELGDISDLGVDLKNLSLNPTIDIKLKDNPTNIPLSGDLSIKAIDEEGNVTKTISTSTINIAGSGASHIILSTQRNAAKYEGMEGVTFIAVDDLVNLLAEGIPSKIAVNMNIKTDKNDIRTIDIKAASGGYKIDYQYSLVMPLEFDGDVNLSYENTLFGLNSTFAGLADTTNGLKVGDVGLIAEFGTTIPFNIVLSAELVNANGTTEGVAARLDIKDCLIKGYTNEEECGEKSVSHIDLNFDLGESGSLEGLKNADGIRLKFALYSAGQNAALKESQYIEGKLKLRVRDGLTIDVLDFLKR